MPLNIVSSLLGFSILDSLMFSSVAATLWDSLEGCSAGFITQCVQIPVTMEKVKFLCAE